MKAIVAPLATPQISMHASFYSPSRSLLRGTLVFCLASVTSLTACLEVQDHGTAELSDTTGSSSGGSSEMAPGSSMEEVPSSEGSTSQESAPGSTDASTGSTATSTSGTSSAGGATTGTSTSTGTSTTTTTTTATTTTTTTASAGDTSSDSTSDETTSTDTTGDTSSDSSSSSDTDTGGPKRDCEKIDWGRGKVVKRGEAEGYVDQDGDDALETDKTDAGMCELHLSGRKCGLVLFGFDG